ncbi:AAA family ATPase [Streptomyces bambusae]|uniref:ATP-binding protein n=1 Tax=Streptomyces bambusae TaxID=1550616 RepID=UPI001CFF6AFB|nr:AAA family ATPase [Streptomyces bambusae]MCB5170014.1 AAA family ATPase [Streptomyces bambusae]
MTERQLRMRRTMFEREAELAAVDEALGELTAAGSAPGGGLLAFAGPAGLGKTTLLAEVRRRAHALGCTVLSARGGEQEQAVAFHVARQLIQPQLAGTSDPELRANLGSWYSIIGPALGLCVAGDGPPPDPQGLRDGLDWVLTDLAVQRAPMVLVLDDAHWADAESLSWLASFAPRTEHLPLLLVVAYRPDELPRHAEAFRVLPGRAGQRPIALDPLTPDAVGRLVREAIGDEADDAFCRECWAVTAGNPYQAVELAEKVRDRNLTPDESGAPLLRDLAATQRGSGLIASLERLGPSTVRFAHACAVLGIAVPQELAARVAGLGTEEAMDAVDRLREARILSGAVNADGSLEFAHPLIATAVYRAIKDGMRVAMHGQAAMAVVDAGKGASAAARHLLETHPDGDGQVVKLLRASAEEHMRAGAPDAARRPLQRALQEPPAFEDRAEVLFELGKASLLTEPANTANHFRTALEEAAEENTVLRQKIVIRLAQVLAHSNRHGDASAALAAEIAVAPDARARLRLQSEQFMWDAFRSDEPDSPARSRKLRSLADHLAGRDLTERYIIGMRAWDATLRGEPVETVLHHARRALGDEFSWVHEDRGFEVPAVVAMTYMYADRPGRAEELFAAGTAELERQGWRGAHLSFAYSLLGYIRFRRGRLVEAEDYARAGLRLAERVGRKTPVHWYAVTILIETLLARGRADEAWELAREHQFGHPFAEAMVFPDSQTVYAELLLARGDRKAAVAELEAVGRRLTPRGIVNPSWCPWQLHLAQAEAVDNPGKARELAEEAVRRARAFGAPSAIGQALRMAAAVTGEGLEEAVEWLSSSPAGYELACAQVALGTELRRTDILHEGLETAVACGADGLAGRAREALSAVGARPRPPLTGEGVLTAREEQAARLIAKGEPVVKVAAALATDEQEVARLLSAVYRKLGTDVAGLGDALPEQSA